jgi:hypothetical protein
MKRSTRYVGLVVHQATTVASVREESSRAFACRTRVSAERDPVNDCLAIGAVWISTPSNSPAVPG